MKAAVLEPVAATGSLDTGHVRDIVLARIACAHAAIGRGEIASDLAPIVAHRVSAGRWRSMLEGEIGSLMAGGLVTSDGSRVRATDAGAAKAGAFLGVKGQLPRDWAAICDTRLIVRTLGLQREPVKRQHALATPEGLRMAIVQRAYNLKIKGVPTPSRLRAALANVALQRAFGNKINAGLAGKTALPAKAGRLLAAQLARKPRNFGTDARLIAALAAEHVDAANSDLASLRLAVLRRYVEATEKAPAAGKSRLAPRPPRLVHAEPTEPARPQALPQVPAGRPDLAGFVREVRRHAADRAQGWAGDRKAYISQVWRAIIEQRPDWGLSEIEFKCMLAEAHRAGQLALANADLKDATSLKELQDSAVLYKNAVFHFVRVEG
jgi:hypothetical protein